MYKLVALQTHTRTPSGRFVPLDAVAEAIHHELQRFQPSGSRPIRQAVPMSSRALAPQLPRPLFPGSGPGRLKSPRLSSPAVRRAAVASLNRRQSPRHSGASSVSRFKSRSGSTSPQSPRRQSLSSLSDTGDNGGRPVEPVEDIIRRLGAIQNADEIDIVMRALEARKMEIRRLAQWEIYAFMSTQLGSLTTMSLPEDVYEALDPLSRANLSRSHRARDYGNTGREFQESLKLLVDRVRVYTTLSYIMRHACAALHRDMGDDLLGILNPPKVTSRDPSDHPRSLKELTDKVYANMTGVSGPHDAEQLRYLYNLYYGSMFQGVFSVFMNICLQYQFATDSFVTDCASGAREDGGPFRLECDGGYLAGLGTHVGGIDILFSTRRKGQAYIRIPYYASYEEISRGNYGSSLKLSEQEAAPFNFTDERLELLLRGEELRIEQSVAPAPNYRIDVILVVSSQGLKLCRVDINTRGTQPDAKVDAFLERLSTLFAMPKFSAKMDRELQSVVDSKSDRADFERDFDRNAARPTIRFRESEAFMSPSADTD